MNESLIRESILITANQRAANIIQVIFASIGFLMSSAQIAVICLWKPLRTFDQMLIFFLAASDFFKAIPWGILAAHRLYLADNGLYEGRTQLECLKRVLGSAVSTHVVMVSMLMISLDRLMALSVPIWYSQRQRKIKSFFVIASVLLGVGFGSLIMIGEQSEVYQVSCSGATSLAPSMRKFFDYADNVFCGIVVLINVISCSIVYWRLRQAMRANENMRLVKKHIQLNAVKMLIVVMILFLFSVYANVFWNAMLANVSISEITKRSLAPIAGCGNLLRGVFDFPIYLIMCREYRNGFRSIFINKIFKCANKNNIVAPTEMTTTRNVVITKPAE